MQVSGVLLVGEAQATARAVGARQRGSQFYYWAALIVLGGLGALAGALLGPRYTALDAGQAGGLGWIAGAILYIALGRRLTVFMFRRTLASRGIQRELPIALTLTPDALVYEVGDVRQIAQWRAVTELFRSSGYWIFLVQGGAWFAPERLFASSADERAFIAQALSCMAPEARARSHDARAAAAYSSA